MVGYLEVYDYGENEHSGEQVHEVGQVLAVEGLTQSAHLVGPRGQQVEQRDHGALELGTATYTHGHIKYGNLLSAS